MALADFLTEGAEIPAGSAVTSMTNQTILPDWYSNYAMNLLASQEALSAQPFATYQGPRVAGFTPDQIGSFAATREAAGAYQPGLTQAVGTTQQAIDSGGGLAAAQPYLGAAAQNATDVSAYTDPYQRAVTDRIAELGQRNLQDVLLPGIEGRYIRAGQFGGSGKMTDTMRAIRDTSRDILGTQAEYLSKGYGQAQSAMQADLARQAQLASTAGNLGVAGQDALLRGGAQQGALAEQAQRLGLAGAGALGAAGQQQQDFNQKNLAVAYEDFLRQQGWPQEQINAKLATMQGVAKAVPTATTQEGISPSGVPATYQPGTAEQIGGALSGLGSVISDPAFQTFLKGLGI